MKINGTFPGFDISAQGLSIQRKRMNLIAENIANADVTRTSDGQPYKRKFLEIVAKQNPFPNNLPTDTPTLSLEVNNGAHISNTEIPQNVAGGNAGAFIDKEMTDQKPGDIVYQPDSPNADSKGYVQESNVNIVTEMVDMISASRSYEANLTALNTSKQMVKDSLGI
ncbi:MAG TPA: flagellar basal body rod protein FlgC [Ignavibacteriaceae bacterium]|nr:flagellar basal body rod protein FlgC [Ignavibacteriaceae bacterium]